MVSPLLALGLPYLLVLPKARDVELLEALDRWVRALVASMSTGRSVTDAIRVSRRTAPPVLAAEVGRLVDRLNNRWDTQEALRGFADALDSPDADGVVAALMLAARRGANGASQTLAALADSIQDQLKGRRLIETERAKPYVVVRQVTIISLVTLAGMFVLSPGFFAGVRHPARSVDLVGAGGRLSGFTHSAAAASPAATAGAAARRGLAVTPVLVMLAGMLVVGGLVVDRRRSATERSATPPALERVSGEAAVPVAGYDVSRSSRPSERLGGWLFRHSPIPLAEQQRQIAAAAGQVDR